MAKKSLGQNFLKSKTVLKKIVESGKLEKGDLVFEIGPGKGALTEALLETGVTVIAIEKDRELIPLLQERFKKEIKIKKLKLIEGDALDIDLKKLKFKSNNFKLIANIPYYITGAIIRRYIGGSIKPKSAVLLVQKEVATRIVARDKKESILSLSVKAYGKPSLIEKVSKTAFSPVPKVDSSILSIEDIQDPFGTKKSEDYFFKLIHNGFQYKRKLLIRNLENIVSKEKLQEFFTKTNTHANVRAEDVSLSFWINLTKF